jgi:hypothetical protein
LRQRARKRGTRLATLLEATGKPEDADAAVALWKTLWQRAGSAARRTQAQERVLDGAARNGTLADVALELEAALAAPETPDRDMVLDALLALYARAKDSAGGLAAIATWESRTGKRVDALERRAMLHQLCDEPVAHEKVLKELVALDPSREIEWRRMIALSLLDRGRAVMARAAVVDLLERPDRTEETDEFAAGILRFIGRPEEAAAACVSGLRLHPDRIGNPSPPRGCSEGVRDPPSGASPCSRTSCPARRPGRSSRARRRRLAESRSRSERAARGGACRAASASLPRIPVASTSSGVLQDLHEALKDDAFAPAGARGNRRRGGRSASRLRARIGRRTPARRNDRLGGADVAREFLDARRRGPARPCPHARRSPAEGRRSARRGGGLRENLDRARRSLERVEDREALRRRRSPGRTPNECVVANCSALPTTSTRRSPWRRRSKNSGASTKRPRST